MLQVAKLKNQITNAASSRNFLSVGHWLALIILLLSVWSGMNLAIDQRPWLRDSIPVFPGMQSPVMWHLFAAVGWLGIVIFYAYFFRQKQLKKAGVVQRIPAPHRRSRRQIYLCLSLVLMTGLILLLNVAGTWMRWFRSIHLLIVFAFVICLIWHVIVEWRIGAWKRISNLFFRISLITSSLVLVKLLFLTTILLGSLHWWQSSQTVWVPKIVGEIRIDGMADEESWRQSSHNIINTYYGAPYDRTVPVEVRMFNDGYTLYIHAKWPDPTRSLQHLPLVKTAAGWKVQQTGVLAADETEHYEDKFAVMVGERSWDALRSVFLSRSVGRGGHLMPNKELVDIWHWKSVRNERFATLDDAHFGPALPPLPGQQRYPWGYASDPLIAGGFVENWAYFKNDVIQPIRLPRKADALQAFQPSSINNPNEAPFLGLNWFATQPYSKSLDTYPVGTVMPSVVWIHPNEGDRADVRAAGVWRDGYWHLEMARNFETGSEFDIDIKNGVYLWFATFDHSQTRHTYHLRPLKLSLEK